VGNLFRVFAFCVTNSHMIGTETWARDIKRYLKTLELKNSPLPRKEKDEQKTTRSRQGKYILCLGPAWRYSTHPGPAQLGQAPLGSRRSALLGSARLVPARLGSLRRGVTRLGSVGPGLARTVPAWLGLARLSSAWLGLARPGWARPGLARPGSAFFCWNCGWALGLGFFFARYHPCI
jgi:hypothetical protein